MPFRFNSCSTSLRWFVARDFITSTFSSAALLTWDIYIDWATATCTKTSLDIYIQLWGNLCEPGQVRLVCPFYAQLLTHISLTFNMKSALLLIWIFNYCTKYLSRSHHTKIAHRARVNFSQLSASFITSKKTTTTLDWGGRTRVVVNFTLLISHHPFCHAKLTVETIFLVSYLFGVSRVLKYIHHWRWWIFCCHCSRWFFLWCFGLHCSSREKKTHSFNQQTIKRQLESLTLTIKCIKHDIYFN